jgi:hypothetical protein
MRYLQRLDETGTLVARRLNMIRKTTILAAALLGLGALTGPVMADDFSQAVKVTFTAPVQIANQTIPAGTYWFQKLANGMSPVQGVMEVRTGDRTQVVATAAVIPVERHRPLGHPVISTAQDENGQAFAILGWYYPGNSIGHEVVYSSRQWRRIREESQSVGVVSHKLAKASTSSGN